MAEDKRVHRSESNRMLGGVCGGLGEYLGVDATLVRIGFVLITLLGGAGLLIYPALWIVIPTESRVDARPPEIARDGWSEIKSTVTRRGRDLPDGR